MFGPTLRKFF